MSSTQQGSTKPGCGRRNKLHKGEKQSRRTWSQKEEAVLLASLKELVANGWKSDNGFRGGYLQKLEDSMVKEFPGTDIQATPHINSKIQIWKRNYYSLFEMLKRSGVGFNDKQEIDCDRDQWAQIVNCDNNARSMRSKSWPMYEDWKEIFGKDRATGDRAEDIMDMVNDMMHESNQAEDGTFEGMNEDTANEEEFSVNHEGENSSCHSEKGEHPAPKNTGNGKGKKRKALDPGVAAVVEVFSEIGRGTHSRLDTIASRIGYEYDLAQEQKDAFMALENIEGLSLDDKFDVCEILVEKTEKLLIFKGLPDEAKAKYVHRLLKSKCCDKC